MDADRVTKAAGESDATDEDLGEGPDALAQKFAELLSKQRGQDAAAAGAKKTPQEPKKPAPQATDRKPLPSTEMGEEPPTISVLVLRNSDDLAEVARTERIGRLILTGDDFTNRSLRNLAGLTVFELSIEAVHVSNAGLQYLESVQGVRRLRLWTPAADDTALTHVAGLPILEVLDIEGTAITGAGLEKLNGLQKLELLVLGSKTADAHLASLQDWPALRQLDLRACSRLTPACFELLAQLPNLKTLWLPSHVRTKGKRMLKESLPTCEVRS